MSSTNPYSTPQPGGGAFSPQANAIDPLDRTKIDAIIKDASQFWLAIVICIFCSALGSLIVPIWYFVRLQQWNQLAKKYPSLAHPRSQATPPNAFRSAKWQLTTGIVAGIVVLCLYILAFAVLVVFGPRL